jgi:proteasome lid subunit RPN8/RPN11
MRTPKTEEAQSASIVVQVRGEVVRAIRQHARSSMTEEICGVLIGTVGSNSIIIHASIEGVNAAQGGAHVTFTHDTWDHIYSQKDKDYPDDKILGWYHSHPGFGVFLSEHDTFIQKNFFSARHQVAWVFDPHSDEEGCFGWNGERIERLARFAVIDGRGGEIAGIGDEELADKSRPQQESGKQTKSPAPATKESADSLDQFAIKFFALLFSAALGFALCWFVFPNLIGVPIPVDPQTGIPLHDLPKSWTKDGKIQIPSAGGDPSKGKVENGGR